MANRRLLLATAAAVLIAGVAMATSDGVKGYKGWRSDASKAERTAPVGQVYVEGDEIPNAAPAVEVAAAGPRSGDAVYKATCQTCHATGAAGAPKMGDKAAWGPRIKKGDAALMKSLTNGFNAMPPKGMCMNCSDDELKAVLDYMVKASK